MGYSSPDQVKQEMYDMKVSSDFISYFVSFVIFKAHLLAFSQQYHSKCEYTLLIQHL